jgi:hypothetical protein
MVYGHTFNGVTVRLGSFITSVLEDLKDFVKYKWDGIGLITGYEGDGKTTLALNCAYYLDHNLNIENVAFNAKQFESIIDSAIPGTCVVWDEADEIAAANWASVMVKTLKRKFKRIRKKRLYILLVTPTMFDLGKYFVIHRTRFLFDVYADPKRDEDGVFHPNRGRAKFYNRDKKRQLYIKGVKEWDMNAVLSNFVDSYTKLPANFPIDMSDEGEYELKKDLAFKDMEEDEVRNITSSKNKDRLPYIERLCVWLDANLNHKISDSALAWIFGISIRTIKQDKATIRKIYHEKGGDAFISACEKGEDSLRDSLKDEPIGGGAA